MQKSIPVNDHGLALLLGVPVDQPFNIILGKPDKSKSVKIKKFAKRVQRRA